MSRFSFPKQTDFSYSSPQEMNKDNKHKKIEGVLDYQSEIMDKYLSKDISHFHDIALDLPTGSGKTLVGLLIGEFLRRKHNYRVVYVCLNLQLVSQVAKEASEKYGIDVLTFTGPFKCYSENDLLEYSNSKKMAITTYKAVFNSYSQFKDPDILIFDDAHGASNLIMSNWSVSISRKNDSLFQSVVNCLSKVIPESAKNHLQSTSSNDSNWVDMVAWPALDQVKKNLVLELSSYFDNQEKDKHDSNYYSWRNIQDHLAACNIYLSEGQIVIAPLIPPTNMLDNFNKAKQRIYLTATPGKDGVLEKAFGVENIERISLPNKGLPSIGRRFFAFPDLWYPEENSDENFFCSILKKVARGVVLVKRDQDENSVASVIKKSLPEIKIFSGKTIQDEMSAFSSSEFGIAILANRYDGVDFPNDVSHLLLVKDLPVYQNLAERFFMSRLKAAPLYDDLVKNRIMQAVGRCTRSANDSAIVVIEGRDLQRVLTVKDKLKLFPPELRAELIIGNAVGEQSKGYQSFIENSELILHPEDDDWKSIDDAIIQQRSEFQKEEQNLPEKSSNLAQIAKLEVRFQRYMWSENYEQAEGVCQAIAEKVTDNLLQGVQYYWRYIFASVQLRKYSEGSIERRKPISDLQVLRREANNLTWFQALDGVTSTSIPEADTSQDDIAIMVDNIEKYILNNFDNGVSNSKRFKKIGQQFQNLEKGIKTAKGVGFEKAVERLGKVLGFESGNPNGEGQPDAWWKLNSDSIVVTEEKVYESNEHEISTHDVRESIAHPGWIKRFLDLPKHKIKIINVFISNSSKIDNAAKLEADGIYFLKRDDLVTFAVKALATVKEICISYNGEGDVKWHQSAIDKIMRSNFTPNEVKRLMTSNRLNNLKS